MDDGTGDADTGEGLTDRQREMLDFERTWWQSDEPRDEAIDARFDLSVDEYYEELMRVLEMPAAMAHDAMVVRRFHRRRSRRRRSLVGGHATDELHPTADGSTGDLP